MKSYKEFITESNSYIEYICKKYGIINYTINKDESIDVDGDVNLSDLKLTKIPLKFGNVSGAFNCNYNQLTTLEGCPVAVGGDFYCHHNKLVTLEGGPEIAGGGFYCHSNQLTTLEGGPEKVGGHFDCSHNQLTTLGGPKTVGGDFYCGYNQLTTLEGSPQTVGGNFYCNINDLSNFVGFPEDFEGRIYLVGNPIVEEIYNLFRTVKCIKWLNEFDVIQGDKVIFDRLEEVYHQLGMEVPENIKLYKYIII